MRPYNKENTLFRATVLSAVARNDVFLASLIYTILNSAVNSKACLLLVYRQIHAGI